MYTNEIGYLRYTLTIANSTVYAYTDLPVIPDGPTGWIHLAFVGDAQANGPGGMKIYMDGEPTVLSASGPGDTTFHDFGDLNLGTSQTAFIGGFHYMTPERVLSPLGGLVDDVRIYDRALDDTEIAALADVDADPAIPADFDSDGDVDGADFLLWQAGYPTDSGATLADGDADGDGDVDGADFLIWQANYPTP